MTEPQPIADGVYRQLDPRVISHQRAIGGIVVAIAAAGTFVGALSATVAMWFAGDLPWWVAGVPVPVWMAAIGGAAWLVYQWPVTVYRHTSYHVDLHGIEIRRGVFWRRVVNVPRSRVQHTDVSQGPLERSHGLGTLVVYTAGTDHAKVELSGLEHARALRIREHLLPDPSPDLNPNLTDDAV